MRSLTNKIDKLSKKYAEEIKKNFINDDPIILLYGSAVEGIETSDLDVCTIVHNYNENDKKYIRETTFKFHVENNLKIDNEVPYENKALYSYNDIEKMILKPPFQILRDKFYISKIKKDPIYLRSEEVKYRLLMCILTSNSVVIYGNEKILDVYRDRAWETLIKVLFSYTGNLPITVNEFLEYLYKDAYTNFEGEEFLGYKRNYKFLHQHLLNCINKYFNEYVKKGDMIKHGEKYYCNELWIKKTITIANSNSFDDVDMDLKKYPLMNVYDFSENSNPLGPSVDVQNALRQCASYINIYGDYKNKDVNKNLADFFNVNEENVTVTNGSIEAIYTLPKFLDSNNATIIVPTFWGYAAGLDALKRKYNKVTLDENLNYDICKIKQAASTSSMMFICNPNNPTSSYICKKDLIEIINENKNCQFILDESFLLFQDNFFEETLSKYINETPNVSIVYSLSKLYSVAGLRVGALISNKNVIKQFKNLQIPYSLNTISQVIFPICINDKDFVSNSQKEIKTLEKELEMQLSQFDWLEVKPSITNFITCKIKNGMTAVELAEKLKKDKVYIRALTKSYPEINGEWIRISVNRREYNNLLIDTLKGYNIK